MAIKKDLLANALKIRGSQSIGDAIYRKLKSESTGNLLKPEEPKHQNGSQSEHNWFTKGITEQSTNSSQSEHNQPTSHIESIESDHNQSTKQSTNSLQLVHKSFTKPIEYLPVKNATTLKKNLSNIIGTQRKLILAIYINCKIFGGTTSQEMTIEHLANLAKCNKKSIKTTIFRLKEKGFIETIEQKSGRGGWIKYRIDQSLYTDILQQESQIFNQHNELEVHNRFTNGAQMVHNQTTQQNTETNTNVSSSSSLINKTTTITNEEKNELPEEWKEIDIESLEELIRFHQGHIKQLFKHGLNLKPVQESIYHYTFDLTENDKAKDIKTDPISFFMGIMKRSGYYAAPENYESPQVRGRRLFLEQEAQKAQKLLEAEKATMSAYFEVWSNKLSAQEKTELVGKDEMTGNGILMQSDKLKKHYREVIWPAHYQKLLNGVE